MKTCGSCKEEKSFAEFTKNKTKKDGLQSACKVCRAKSNKKYRDANPEKEKERARRYGKDNREKITKSKRKNREANPLKKKEYDKKRRELNLEEEKERCQRYYYDNYEKEKERKRIYRENNIEKAREWQKNKRANDIAFKMCDNLRSRLHGVLKSKRKTGSAVRDLGCSGQYLADYLESLWSQGMSWENYGKKKDSWNIDHIVPLSAFNLQDRQHFVLANHYLNLQPMWHVDNMSKNDTLPWEIAA